MSLAELSSWRQAAESGSVSLSSEEVSSLLSEIRERWSDVSAMLSGGVVPVVATRECEVFVR